MANGCTSLTAVRGGDEHSCSRHALFDRTEGDGGPSTTGSSWAPWPERPQGWTSTNGSGGKAAGRRAGRAASSGKVTAGRTRSTASVRRKRDRTAAQEAKEKPPVPPKAPTITQSQVRFTIQSGRNEPEEGKTSLSQHGQCPASSLGRLGRAYPAQQRGGPQARSVLKMVAEVRRGPSQRLTT